ncbi:MAG: flavin reductase [Thermotogae bacterium]|nr:MAG: flavin reductase [Thermotogota bacterium]RKX38050.1 MAG: flavin reductase [Thermotogota bacterium]
MGHYLERAVWCITTGVYVITTKAKDGRINGMGAAWVNRVSEVPPIVSIAVWENNYTYELVGSADYFVINILSEGQQAIARHFGRQSGRDVDKFEDVDYQVTKNGTPYLPQALAIIEARIVFRRKFGDHMLIVGDVVEERVQHCGVPLVYRHEDYFKNDEVGEGETSETKG